MLKRMRCLPSQDETPETVNEALESWLATLDK